MWYENENTISLIKLILLTIVLIPIVVARIKHYVIQKQLEETRKLFNKKQVEKLKRKWKKM